MELKEKLKEARIKSTAQDNEYYILVSALEDAMATEAHSMTFEVIFRSHSMACTRSHPDRMFATMDTVVEGNFISRKIRERLLGYNFVKTPTTLPFMAKEPQKLNEGGCSQVWSIHG